MNRIALIAFAAGFAAAPAAAQAPKTLECPITIAHGCSAEKCQNVGQMPTFRIDVAGKKVCYSMGGTPCTGGETAEIFESTGGALTIGVGSQRMILWIDDKLKMKGARISNLGVAAFFSDCKAM